MNAPGTPSAEQLKKQMVDLSAVGRVLRISIGVWVVWAVIMLWITLSRLGMGICEQLQCALYPLIDLGLYGILIPGAITAAIACFWFWLLFHIPLDARKERLPGTTTDLRVRTAARWIWFLWLCFVSAFLWRTAGECLSCYLKFARDVLVYGLIFPRLAYDGLLSVTGIVLTAKPPPFEPATKAGLAPPLPAAAVSDEESEEWRLAWTAIHGILRKLWIGFAILMGAVFCGNGILCKFSEASFARPGQFNCGMVHFSLFLWWGVFWPLAAYGTIRLGIQFLMRRNPKPPRIIVKITEMEARPVFRSVGRVTAALWLCLALPFLSLQFGPLLRIPEAGGSDMNGTWMASMTTHALLLGGEPVTMKGVLSLEQRGFFLLGYGGKSLNDPEPDLYWGTIYGDVFILHATGGMLMCPGMGEFVGRVADNRMAMTGSMATCFRRVEVQAVMSREP